MTKISQDQKGDDEPAPNAAPVCWCRMSLVMPVPDQTDGGASTFFQAWIGCFANSPRQAVPSSDNLCCSSVSASAGIDDSSGAFQFAMSDDSDVRRAEQEHEAETDSVSDVSSTV